MIPILLDQGLPRSTVTLLRGVGWDINHVGELGMSRARDEEILRYARREGCTIVTLDADFHAIVAVENASGPTVIRIRIEGLNGQAMANLLTSIWPRIEEHVTRGAMITVTSRTIRIRHLPLSENP